MQPTECAPTPGDARGSAEPAASPAPIAMRTFQFDGREPDRMADGLAILPDTTMMNIHPRQGLDELLTKQQKAQMAGLSHPSSGQAARKGHQFH